MRIRLAARDHAEWSGALSLEDCAGGRPMAQQGKEFGRDPADRMSVRMRLQRITTEQVTYNVAVDVAKHANDMLRTGQSRHDVAAWIEQVQIGYVERLDEWGRVAEAQTE